MKNAGVSVRVTPELSGRPLDGVVRALFRLSWGEARARIESGKVTVDGTTRTNPRARVREGSAVGIQMSAPKPRPDALPEDAIVHIDAHVVVVNKPAGVSTVPYEEGERGTLDERVRALLARRDPRTKKGGSPRPPLGVVHRLDKETSGLIVFSRTWLAKKSLASQFRAHTTLRRYVTIAHGEVRPRTIRSHLVANRGDGLRGSLRRSAGTPSRDPPGAQLAITHIVALEALDGATLIACRLETGRTHQIRIHLSEAGHPILGERVYVRHHEGVLIPAPRLMLHAAELGFIHPATGAPMRWEVPPPTDFEETLNRLRHQ
jgi:23S rRNA pseudouridine1911/1915/1917 synthase